ncbi:MAG: HEAT repeat domain-containing protein [Planctomycetaceae bacterium]
MTDGPVTTTPIADLPDDLPPVKPPSIGFIFQLFIFPALIVAAVIAVWVLFGKLASGEQDWRTLVGELSSPNHHIRNRAMFGLAQLLDNDQRRGDQGQQLARNPQIAQGLAEQLTKELNSQSVSKETIDHQVYLTRALGLLDVPDVSLPPLVQALDAVYDVEVRKSACISVAMISGRTWERGDPLSSPQLAQGLVQLSQDGDKRLRRAAAFALGLLDPAVSQDRLMVLLEDADWMTQVNAAVALSRQGSLQGYGILREIMTGKVVVDPEVPDEAPATELIILKNGLDAVKLLAKKLSPEQNTEMETLIGELLRTHRESRVRADAAATLAVLKAGEES